MSRSSDALRPVVVYADGEVALLRVPRHWPRAAGRTRLARHLAALVVDDDRARDVAPAFSTSFVASLTAPWTLTGAELLAAVERVEADIYRPTCIRGCGRIAPRDTQVCRWCEERDAMESQ